MTTTLCGGCGDCVRAIIFLDVRFCFLWAEKKRTAPSSIGKYCLMMSMNSIIFLFSILILDQWKCVFACIRWLCLSYTIREFPCQQFEEASPFQSSNKVAQEIKLKRENRTISPPCTKINTVISVNSPCFCILSDSILSPSRISLCVHTSLRFVPP